MATSQIGRSGSLQTSSKLNFSVNVVKGHSAMRTKTPSPLQKISMWMNHLDQNSITTDPTVSLYPRREENFSDSYNYHFEHNYSSIPVKLTERQTAQMKVLKRKYNANNFQQNGDEKIRIIHTSNYKPTDFSSQSPINHHTTNNKLPPFPENEKKKELCNYLQLMKPNERKTSTAVNKYRRSRRVENSNKKLDAKSNKKNGKMSTSRDKSTPSINANSRRPSDDDNNKIKSSSSPSSASTAKLSADSKRNNNKTTPSQSYSIPKPSNTLMHTIQDFDEVVKENIEIFNVNNNNNNNAKKQTPPIVIDLTDDHTEQPEPKIKIKKKKTVPISIFRPVTRSSGSSPLISAILYSLRSRKRRHVAIAKRARRKKHQRSNKKLKVKKKPEEECATAKDLNNKQLKSKSMLETEEGMKFAESCNKVDISEKKINNKKLKPPTKDGTEDGTKPTEKSNNFDVTENKLNNDKQNLKVSEKASKERIESVEKNKKLVISVDKLTNMTLEQTTQTEAEGCVAVSSELQAEKYNEMNSTSNFKSTDSICKSLKSNNEQHYVGVLKNLESDAYFSSLSMEHKRSLCMNGSSLPDTPPLHTVFAIYDKQRNNITAGDGNDDSGNDKRHEIIIENQQNDVKKSRKLSSSRRASTKIPIVNVEDSSKEQSNKNNEPIKSSPLLFEPIAAAAIATNGSSVAFAPDLSDTSPEASSELLCTPNRLTNWSTGNTSTNTSTDKSKKNRHSINISMNEHGKVLKVFYLKHNLVLCQDLLVSFWTQTALGNVLGAQNMWIHKGNVQRLSVNANCNFVESLEMVVSTENNLAYIELWTEEHESELRARPVADIFAIIYFWKKGQNRLDKKVLQLENIKSYADDVQYCVLEYYPKIIVSWHITSNELQKKETHIFHYHLAADYQTVYSKTKFASVEHYVSSLHTVEDGETIIAGCGENKLTLWNIEDGYIVATVEMLEIKSPLCTLWVKYDRGFLFTLQQCVDRELRLIAIHSKDYSWKKLASYVPPKTFDILRGVCTENGIILAFYNKGTICWKSETADTIVEEANNNDTEFVSGKYIISVTNDGQVNIRHMLTYLLCSEETVEVITID